MATQITGWQTVDGEIFDDEEEAVYWEQVLHISNSLKSLPSLGALSKLLAKDRKIIAELLLEKYDIKVKDLT